MVNGIHALVYSKDVAGVRSFFNDVLGLPSVDAGDGWLIFSLPPAELAAHPIDEETHHELYPMCDNIAATTEHLKAKGIIITEPIANRGWGLVTRIQLPGGDTSVSMNQNIPRQYQPTIDVRCPSQGCPAGPLWKGRTSLRRKA